MKRSLIVTLVIAFAALGALLVSLPTSAQSSAPVDLTYDPLVATMIGQVQTITVELYDQELSGRVAAIIGGAPYTITSRNTNSGTPIQKATQYAYEKMQSAGLAVSYHDWTGCSISNRNVVGVMTGTLRPSEIVLITAHIDDMPSSGAAPGADDNASGSVGVLMAAKIMSQYHFERTVRFVLFTGEEQGLCGSAQYANYIYGRGDNVVAVYNMDMIAYDVANGPTLRLHTRTTTSAGYPADLAIAGVFTNVVNTYGMSSALTPIVDPDGESASDHASFWSKGYPGILAIEDDANDFNAYYHTINDNYDHVNLTYFTNYVKASIGTAAHLAYPIRHYAVLKGVVTDAGTTLPIANARIRATASITMSGITSTNASGAYALLLLDGMYTVTYSAYGYQPQTIADLTLPPDVTTTQDVSLTTGLFHIVSGTIRNATQGWPITASISIAGYPTGTVVNDPVTGFYSVTLAENVDYTFLVSSNGYASVSRHVGLLTADRTENFDLNADMVACTAPGYTWFGASQSFDTTSTPPGWSVVNNIGTAGWRFDNPEPRSNNTGGTGNFVIADSDYAGSGVSMDTELRTPPMDLSTLTEVTLTFKTDFHYYTGGQSEIADVDVSVNGTAGPWQNVWRRTSEYRGPHTEVINLTSIAAGQSNVMVRFHYYNAIYEWWWEVDDVQLGQCVAWYASVPALSPANANQSGLLGSTVVYTLQMSNTGYITDTFALSIAGNAWPTSWSPMTATLAPSQTASLIVSVTILMTVPINTSDVALITMVDSGMSAHSLLTTSAYWPYGMPSVSPADASQSGTPGSTVMYMLQISNTGGLTDTFTLGASGYAWPTSLSPITATLAPSQTASLIVSVTIPLTVPANATDATLITISSLGPSAHSLLTTRAYLPHSEPSLSPANANQSGAPGSTVTYTLQMSNTGNLTDTFMLSAANNLWPTFLAPITATLAPSQTASLIVSVTIPISTPSYTLDIATITMAGSGAQAHSTVQTLARWPVNLYLPVIIKDLP